jgi:hypothetical protein
VRGPRQRPFGGIDNFAHCGGGDGGFPCPETLWDREQAPRIRSADKLIDERLKEAEEGIPLRESLEAQNPAITTALRVVGGQRHPSMSRAEKAFREAFERLKQGKPTTVADSTMELR